jgi:hypothetical protein
VQPDEPLPLEPTVIAELHGEKQGLIGLVKVGDLNTPLIFEPVSPGGEVPQQVHTLWQLLRYLNRRIREASCLDEFDGKTHTVSFPLNPAIFDIIRDVINRIGADRVSIKWRLEEAQRDGRILHIPHYLTKKT